MTEYRPCKLCDRYQQRALGLGGLCRTTGETCDLERSDRGWCKTDGQQWLRKLTRSEKCGWNKYEEGKRSSK